MMKVGAGEHQLAPTFQAFADIEAAIDTSLVHIYQLHQNEALKITEIAQIICIGANQAGGDFDIHDTVKHLHSARAVTDPKFRRKFAEYLLALAWSPEDRGKKLESEWSEQSQSKTPVSAFAASSVSLQ